MLDSLGQAATEISINMPITIPEESFEHLTPIKSIRNKSTEFYSGFSKSPPAIATGLETLGSFILDTAHASILEDESNHAKILNELRLKNPLSFDFKACIIGPVAEELTYRTPSWIVSRVAPTAKISQLVVDVVSSVRFSEVHRSGGDPFQASHFIGGLQLAWLARNRGLRYSVFSHIAYNSLCTALDRLIDEPAE